MILFLLVVTATFRPPAPTVGDLITIEFEAPVQLDSSPDYEIVAAGAQRVTIRSFVPRPFALSGRIGEVRFQNLMLPMRSVLKDGDTLEPSPLEPPRKRPLPRPPLLAIAGAALAAALIWWAVRARSRARHHALGEPDMAPAERFRQAVDTLRRSPQTPLRWAGLADETRRYLATIAPELGSELTTTELLVAYRRAAPAGPLDTLASILHQGDLEKFSPFGPHARDFDSLAGAALALIPPEPVAEEAQAA